ncbi:MAG: hybrid sensor histidine kinase/response regulator, partial [Telluria sp.]
DRRKDEFLATLAHELRNPLGPIRSAVELLCKLEPVVPAAQDRARKTIARHTDHLVRLVDDLLDVARISQGKITLHQERVELKSSIASALESVAGIVESRHHRLDITLPEHEVWIKGDQVRLCQIIGNLLHNAAKFTPPDGALSLQLSVDGEEAVIRVSDNGIGIDAANIDFIFGLFAQDGHSTDRVQDGLGIGLSLVQSLVALHSGTVSASSAGRGKGSTFEVRLPAYAWDQGNDEKAMHPKQGTAATRILVVDDNVDAANTLAELLGIDGHDVITAYLGADALERAEDFQPRFVFLDIGLPDMTGYEVAAKMRKIEGMETAVLIALTGYGQARDRELAMDAGFNEHVVKPIDFAKVTSLNLHTR